MERISNGRHPVDLIIWDLDGTLADTIEDITESLNRTLAPQGIPARTAEEVAPFIGRGIGHLLAQALDENPDSPHVAEAIRVFREDYSANLIRRTALFPGVLEVLEHFSDKTHAVISNKLQSMTEPIVEGLGIGHLMAEVIGADGDYPIKPDPASTLAVIAAHGTVPERTAFIGDSDTDFLTARNAGCISVLVTYGLRPAEEVRGFPADAHLDDIRELIKVLA